MIVGHHSREPESGKLRGLGGEFSVFTTWLPRETQPLFRYGLSVAVTLGATLLTLLFPQGTGRPYYIFLVAVVTSGWYGGLLPGLFSTVASAFLGWWFVYRPEAIQGLAGGLARYLGFISATVLVYGLTVALQRSLQALRTSQLRFGGVVQISEDAILTVDEQQQITLFNSGAEKIFGFRADDVLGKPLSILIPERYRGIHDRHVREFAKAPDALRAMNQRGTIFGRRADGSEFPAEASIAKFESSGQKILTVRLRDVSERHAAEHRLRQMAAIVESSQDAIVSESLEGTILSWNPAAEKLFGYTANEAVGRNARVLLPPGAPDEVSANLAKVQEGQSTTLETIRMKRDGKPVAVALTLSPIREELGGIVGASTIFRDITERKHLEQQLLHSQKMEAVGQLAGGVAHDFNNLLSIVVGYAYLIQTSTAEGEPMHDAATEIMTASDKAAALTRQLLAFSRKQVLRPEVLDLNEVVNGIGRILPRLIGEDVDLRIVAGSDLNRVKADPGQIEQVLMNLVVNARDAMPVGGTLTIETDNVYFDEEHARRHGIQSGDYVLLAVSDNGHGMDEATRQRIFEPFFTTKAAGKGTGLGLATVYGIVNQSNGHIWVYSEPGHGTTFKIYLPATDDARTRRLAGKPEPAICGRETVLLVEDELHLRDLLAHILRERGYHVLSAGNGHEALGVARDSEQPLDLLLTDVVMPGMRGHALAEQLSQLFPDMKVIYMSGYTDNALTHNGSLPSGTVFLQKPFTPDVVLKKVREVLQESANQRSQRRQVS